MRTTCPECLTTFRITQAQLERRRGLVRCGRCSAVFNAYDTLQPDLQAPADWTAATAAARPQPDAGPEPMAATALPAGDQAPLVPDRAVTSDTTADRPQPKTSVLAANVPAGPAAPQAATADDSPDSILLTALPTRAQRHWPGLVWQGLAIVALSLLFLLQLAYFLRAEIALAAPGARSLLQAACARIGCTLPWPQDLAALRIEASALETEDEDRSHAVLQLTLSNRGPHTVAWPHLLLTLTDVRDAPVARRPFSPQEYLAGRADPARGIPPGHEEEIRLQLQIEGLQAHGYKLEKLYP
ncbi:MAG: DUF3426 domain-containing protein [Thiobacillaceae bacterium]|nr:DUF3426 domain-containing protein [Thiobacillaceae bacterium]